MYGQTEPGVPAVDARGVVPFDEAARLRGARAREQWERVDSIVIGEGATNTSRGWFNTWQDFASADKLQWFSGRDSNVGASYTNQDGERTDWAQDIYDISVQFIAPPGVGDLETDANDVLNTQMLYGMLMNQLSLKVILSESDSIANAPADHFPAGFGISYPLQSSQATPVTVLGNNGEPVVGNTWKFPTPIMLAAKSRITVEGRIDNPVKSTFRAIGGPGAKLIPTGVQGQFVRHPNYYTIKITCRGPRYLQLRGARSSA